MTLALRPSDVSPLVAELGFDPSRDVPRRALDGYVEVASALPGIWPCVPDEERVRYYTWAARQVREARVAITAAMELLNHVAFFTNVLAEQLDDFAATGRVPHMDDIDLDVTPGDPVARILGLSGLYESASSATPPTPITSAKSARKATRKAIAPPKAPSEGARACESCGTLMPHPKWFQKFCCPACRVEAHRQRAAAR